MAAENHNVQTRGSGTLRNTVVVPSENKTDDFRLQVQRPTVIVPVKESDDKSLKSMARRVSAKRGDRFRKVGHKARQSILARRGKWIEKQLEKDNLSLRERAQLKALSHMRSSNPRGINLVGMSILGYGKAIYDPFAAAHLPLSVQVDFRRKVFTILSLQLWSVTLLTSLLLFVFQESVTIPATGWKHAQLEVITPSLSPSSSSSSQSAPSIFAGGGTRFEFMLAAFLVSGFLLCGLFCVKHIYPYNMITLLLFTTAESCAVAFFSVYFSRGGGVTFFAFLPRILGFMALCVTFMTFLVSFQKKINVLPPQCRATESGIVEVDLVTHEHNECTEIEIVNEDAPRRFFENPQQPGTYIELFTFGRAGAFAWCCAACILVPIYYTVLQGSNTFTAITFSLLVTALIAFWVAFDAECLARKISPDEYMSAVIFFYTDFILVLVFLIIILGFIIILCLSGNTGDGDGGGGGGGDAGAGGDVGGAEAGAGSGAGAGGTDGVAMGGSEM